MIFVDGRLFIVLLNRIEQNTMISNPSNSTNKKMHTILTQFITQGKWYTLELGLMLCYASAYQA